MDPNILDSYRRWGYLQADLDWLGRLEPAPHPDLDVDDDEAAEARKWYCGTLAVEFMHIPAPDRRAWIQSHFETEAEAVDKRAVLEQLMRASILEEVLQSRYVGNKRFSIEGHEALVVLLNEALAAAAERETEAAVLAMSHRGRLSVMVNVVGVRARDVLAGFEDVDPRSIMGAGDVKYHLGATGVFESRSGHRIDLHLVSNPSHLEAVDPVALGRVKAKQLRRHDDSGVKVIPLIMHGDAALAGQGIAAEAFNLADLDGYSVGGSLHIVVNNLIGFTTDPPALYSSRFASDVAKRLPIPILHVNAEDPLAVVRAARLAVGYRYAFRSDVVIDLIGFRRHGHSEVDDPSITQPRLYAKISDRPPLWQSFARRVGFDESDTEDQAAEVRQRFGQAKEEAEELEEIPRLASPREYWEPYEGGRHSEDLEIDTGVSVERLREIAGSLTTAPEGFHVHPKVARLLEQRSAMGRGDKPVDYGMAEALALGSLLTEGVPVRFAGQDTRRGTFSHRHSVLIDHENEDEYAPLAHLAPDQARFDIYDSMLSEAAVLGFEYGYSRDFPETLVAWEAQFGDFVNGAQIILDQFVTAGEDKWNLLSGIVLLLPHGFEGQGPEHSSARIERFLQLAAEHAIQVAQPSTAAQYFHLLRRQALRKWRKPLIVFTPKSMLRSADAASPIEQLSEPRFRRILTYGGGGESISRVLFCTGKIGHELRAERARRERASIAIVSIEQLYPFPRSEVRAELERFSRVRDIVWVQEEPANMGALEFVVSRLEELSGDRRVRSVKRS
ncbi:MAG: 2-oxoglutarate dehydrogenase E1 component, partial [Acidobacteriota bacterium]